MVELTGIVKESCTTPRGCGGLITVLKIKPLGKQGIVLDINNGKVEMKIAGSHRIDVGERIRVNYKNNSGVYWVSQYYILSKKGKVLYTSVEGY